MVMDKEVYRVRKLSEQRQRMEGSSLACMGNSKQTFQMFKYGLFVGDTAGKEC